MPMPLWLLMSVILIMTHLGLFMLGRWSRREPNTDTEEVQQLKWANEVLMKRSERLEQQLAKREQEDAKRRQPPLPERLPASP